MLSRTMRAAAAAMVTLFAAAAHLPAQERVEVHREPGSRGWLGFSFRSEGDGSRVIIERVLPGSPAARAGVAAGDTLVQIDGRAATERAMDEMREGLKPGDRVQLTLRHGGSQAQRTVVAARRPGQNVVVLGRSIRISDDSMAEPIVIQLDSLNALSRPEMRRMLDSLGLDIRGMQEMGRVRSRELRVQMDSLHTGMMRIHMDSLRRHLDSLSFRMDSLRVHLRHVYPGGVPGQDGEYIVEVGPDGLPRAGRVTIRGDGAMERAITRARTPFFLDLGRRALGGAELVDLNDGLGSYFSTRHGALVLQVSPGTPAARAGLQPGDVVVRAGDRDVASVADLRGALNRDDDGRLSLQVLRHGRRQNLQLQWERADVERATVIRAREQQRVERARQRAEESRRPKSDQMNLNHDEDDDALVLP
jgi:hypothetical protein